MVELLDSIYQATNGLLTICSNSHEHVNSIQDILHTLDRQPIHPQHQWLDDCVVKDQYGFLSHELLSAQRAQGLLAVGDALEVKEMSTLQQNGVSICHIQLRQANTAILCPSDIVQMSDAILVISEACVSTLQNGAVEDLALLRHLVFAGACMYQNTRDNDPFIAYAFTQSIYRSP